MSFMTSFVVKRYETREEYKFELDTEFVYTGELKKLLEPLTGLPVHDQILAYEGEIMRDEQTLLDGSLQSSSHRVVLSSKSQRPPVSHIEPPPDWNAEENPMFKTMLRFMDQHYTKQDLSALCYHMAQYVRELSHNVSFHHLEVLAEKNLKIYDDLLRSRRKRYYELFERCIYLERRIKANEARRTENPFVAAFRAQQEALQAAEAARRKT